MRKTVLAGFAVLMTGVGLSGPAAADQVVGDYRQTPVYGECRRQTINDNQCYCVTQWVYGNGWGLDKTIVVKVMQAYPLTSQQSVGDEIYRRIDADGDAIDRAVSLMVDATNYCSKFEAR